MVLGGWRHSLSDSHDVDDACQATLPTLIRLVSGLRDRHHFGTWLQELERCGPSP